MINDGDYSIGAELDSNAPWNKKNNKPREVEVTASITISKTLKVLVDDYEIDSYIDEAGSHFTDYNYENCDLKKAVQEQVSFEGVRDWNVDDFEVILEN